ncbi:hypothetical protein HUA76_42425 [Myxococcus sp. CA056]|uniref:hypothetical protein n=1 Tax=Myxococcus sp. CA056 TaxID=2741740 RepID=UPI00157A34D2|nr:hypothetical protein [Myxococcus sp. CA056]NTX17448.1 hypothetical protein [Myxococcus sp. CA056]
MLPRRKSSHARSWLLPGTQLDYEIARAVDMTFEDGEGFAPVAGGLAIWHLDRWLAGSRATVYSLYETLGGMCPMGLSTLERTHFEQRLKQRLERALLDGELTVREVPLVRHVPPPFTEPVVIEREAPMERPAPPPPAPEQDIAAQVRALRQAAADGTPFCEECAKKALQGPQKRAA